tara:strand:+ start:104 stop:367 length:264 start_codon:yes stop_codon:yes gene_type:complete
LILKKYSKNSVITERLAPKYARQSPWLAFVCLILCGKSIAQDLAYNNPEVNIYESPELNFKFFDSGDYILPEYFSFFYSVCEKTINS